MTIFKSYFKIISKSKFIILAFIFSFLLIAFLITEFNSSPSDSNFNLNYNMTIVDMEKTDKSKGLVEYLSGIYNVTVEENFSYEDIQMGLYSGTLDYGLLIDGDGFSYYDIQDSPYTIVLSGKINEFLNLYDLLEAKGIDDVSENVKTILNSEVDYEILNTTSKNSTGFFKHLSYTLPMAILTIIYLGYRNMLDINIKRRFIISKTNIDKITLRILISSILVIFAVSLINISAPTMWLNLTAKELLLYGSNTLALSLAIISMGYLVSRFSNSFATISAINNGVILSLCFISGVFVSLEYIPDFLVNIASIFPLYWYVDVVEAIGSGNQSEFYFGIGIQILMAIVFMLLNILLNRIKIREE